MESLLVRMCIEAVTESADAVEKWRRQRRTLEPMPSHLDDALLRSLLGRRLLFPSLLEYDLGVKIWLLAIMYLILGVPGAYMQEQSRKEREELDKMLEENRRRVEEAQRREALELQRKEEERLQELELIQRQKEEAARRR
ncbi:hypothetical protein OROHE_012519 [Orobanche hederae]